ncbi:hypothetical protein AYO20_08093 [Fonsecaea nubica]|uniref:Uncharacterized protein n=1 Tax=Fonsecaea nubica TaxID=856822 RepID=A0A178CPD2_9EURO|nr:hypothetical protein AYO20_08093 [Fonsecaea nubica]OAL31700.1 hypothetical protein AYO20_08093 [Fonsecaea nubica]
MASSTHATDGAADSNDANNSNNVNESIPRTRNPNAHCPETVDADELEQALKDRESWTNVAWKGVHVLDIDEGGTSHWRRNLDGRALERFLSDSHPPPQNCFVRVLYASLSMSFPLFPNAIHDPDSYRLLNPDPGPNTHSFLESLGPGHTDTEIGDVAVDPTILRLLRARVGLSDLLIMAVCGLGHWYTIKHGHFIGWDERRKAQSFAATACTQVSTSLATGSSIYFCLNFPPSAVPRLALHNLRVPFKLDVVVADETLRLWQREMATIRGRMKRFEANEPHEAVDSMIRELHRLSRSWQILFRKVSEFEAHLDFLHEVRTSYVSLAEPAVVQSTSQPLEKSGESLAFLMSSCRSLRQLVADYRARTATQINLLFHLANQAESRDNKEIAAQNKEIAELTARIAQQTQRDSASMITIAAVTMFFLPGTFVSSLLSTVVFNFDGTDISVSQMWWILPATAIPMTFFVFAIWLLWLRRRLSHDRKAMVTTDGAK